MTGKTDPSIIDNKITPDVTIPIGSKHRKSCRLDWAESRWTRWIHVILWTWLNPILNIGYKRPLVEEDLTDISPKDECHRSLKRLEAVWEANEHTSQSINTWKMIAKAFWKECLLAGLIQFPYMCTAIAQPLFLKEIVLTINIPA